jgi:hypothetical protein
VTRVRDALSIIDTDHCVGITVRPGNGVVLFELELWDEAGGERVYRLLEVDTFDVGNLASALRKFARIANG